MKGKTAIKEQYSSKGEGNSKQLQKMHTVTDGAALAADLSRHRGKIDLAPTPREVAQALWTAPTTHFPKESKDAPCRDYKPMCYLGTLPKGDTDRP